MQTAPRLHLRCTACGKLSKPDAFTGDHDLEALTQSFVGGGRGKKETHGTHGFVWERHALEPDQAELIRDALRGAEKRIDKMLGGEGTADKEDLSAISAAQLKADVRKLRREKARDRETIRLQNQEIKKLAKLVLELADD